MDKKRKTIIKVLKYIGFSIEIQTKFRKVDFIDAILNLQNGTYDPHRKSNDKLI